MNCPCIFFVDNCPLPMDKQIPLPCLLLYPSFAKKAMVSLFSVILSSSIPHFVFLNVFCIMDKVP